MKFSEFDLHPAIQAGIEKMGFVECTDIQEAAIPYILAGKDLAGLAQTGTGKTAAFLLPLIDRILRSQDHTQSLKSEGVQDSDQPDEREDSDRDLRSVPPVEEISKEQARLFPQGWRKKNFILVLVPTRELADQVYKNVKDLCPGGEVKAVAVFGGTSYDKQKAAMQEAVEIVVATPGRLIDLYKEHIVDLRQVKAVVFDEADRMFDMGFKDDMKFILKRIPNDRQFLVFSATLNFDVLNTAYEFGADPVEINISKDQATAVNVEDEIFHVGHNDKPSHLLSLLKKHAPKQVIVFSNFKRNVERIALFLNKNGYPALGISSLLTQAQRNRVMDQFKSDRDAKNILVATDVAARGLDILGVDMVINYELPDDPENYVHRIGRTGRAGCKGQAFSLVSDRDVEALARIEDYTRRKIDSGWIEDTELVKQFESFPADRDLEYTKGKQPRRDSDGPRKKRGDSRKGRGGPRDKGRDGERFKSREQRPADESRERFAKGKDRKSKESDRPDRPERADRLDRTDRSERTERPERTDQRRSRTDRPERTDRPDRPERKYSKGKRSEHHNLSREEGSGQTHRDRRTGRHKSSQRDSSAANGSKSYRSKPIHNKNRRRRSSQRVTPPPQSLGQKVGGFFKKLFGG